MLKQHVHDKTGYKSEDIEVSEEDVKSDVRERLVSLIGLEPRFITIHRVYTADDGWMTGYENVFVIVEYKSQLFKLSADYCKGDPKFMYHHQCGGSSPLKLKSREDFETDVWLANQN